MQRSETGLATILLIQGVYYVRPTVEPPMALSLGSNLRPVVSRGSPGYIWRMAFGIGFQELVIIAVLFLVIFGPSKLPQMARDIGRFVTEARRSVDEFKSELVLDDEDENRRPKRKR